jgi:uncharacterized membrane protein YgcG
METVVIWLAIPVALAVEHAQPRKIGVAGVALAVAAVLLAAIARRRLSWTLVGGSVLQLLVIAAGVIVPVMYFLGGIFAALWVIGIVLGYRFEGYRAQTAGQAGPTAPPGGQASGGPSPAGSGGATRATPGARQGS